MVCYLFPKELKFRPVQTHTYPRSRTSCKRRPGSLTTHGMRNDESTASSTSAEGNDIQLRAKSPTPSIKVTGGMRSSYSQSRGRRSRTPGTSTAATACFAVRSSESSMKGSSSQSNDVEAATVFSIPTSDVIAIDVLPSSSNLISPDHCECVYITARNLGCSELSFYDLDSQEILLAFLKAWVPSRRFQQTDLTVKNDAILKSDSSSCLDMETWTQKAVEKRFQNESAMDRINRRLYRFVSSMEEIICVCGDNPNTMITVPTSSMRCSSSIGQISTSMELDETSFAEMNQTDIRTLS